MGRRRMAVLWVCLMVAIGGRAEAQLDQFVQAKSYCIMDADTGKVLSSLNPQMMLPPASTLKVGTALMAVNTLKLTDRVPVSYHAAEAPPSKICIRPGETYSVQELLYAILLPSANDAARALGERMSGSEERFAAFMTSRLHQMGAYRTNFETASGLPDPGQYSTAYDLALIFSKAVQNPTLAKIMGTKTYILPNGKQVRNHNWCLFSTDYAVAGKTGYTRASKHTYVGMFQNNDKRIIVSLMGSPDKWSDLRILIPKGFSEIGAPIPPLPHLKGFGRYNDDGYECASSPSHRAARGKSKYLRSRSGNRTYLRDSTSGRGVVKASLASSGGKSSTSQGQKKKSNKAKASSSSCSKSRS
jgi:D-alanyl-D-alanine carboxypeptidase